jgi:hypothetical protein
MSRTAAPQLARPASAGRRTNSIIDLLISGHLEIQGTGLSLGEVETGPFGILTRELNHDAGSRLRRHPRDSFVVCTSQGAHFLPCQPCSTTLNTATRYDGATKAGTALNNVLIWLADAKVVCSLVEHHPLTSCISPTPGSHLKFSRSTATDFQTCPKCPEM